MHKREELTIEKFLKLNYAPTLIISFFFLSLTLLLLLFLSLHTHTILMSPVITACFYLYWIPLHCLPSHPSSSYSRSIFLLIFLFSSISSFFHPLRLIRELHPSVTEQMISYLAFSLFVLWTTYTYKKVRSCWFTTSCNPFLLIWEGQREKGTEVKEEKWLK